MTDSVNTYDWVNNKISYKITPSCLDTLILFFVSSGGYSFNEDKGDKCLNGQVSDQRGYLKLRLSTTDSLELAFNFDKAAATGLATLLAKAKERIYGW